MNDNFLKLFHEIKLTPRPTLVALERLKNPVFPLFTYGGKENSK